MFKKTNKKGFTLIELIIVVAIMAILVALLAPNVLKYLEKSRVGKDISALDSVHTAVKAETTDEVLSKYSTDGDAEKVQGITIETIAAATGDSDLATLASRLFGDNKALGDEFENSDFLASNAADGATVMVFIDGQGGIAIAAVNAEGLVTYEGQDFIVGNLDKTEIDATLPSAE